MIEAIREVLDAGSTLIFYTVRDNDVGKIVNEKSNMKDSTRSAIPISTKHNASSDRKWLTEGQFSRPRCSMHQSRFVFAFTKLLEADQCVDESGVTSEAAPKII